MFCASGVAFDDTECAESSFHILRSLTRIQRYGGRQIQFYAPVPVFGCTKGVGVKFSWFALPDPFSVVLRVSGSSSHGLRSRTRFLQYRGHQV
jgi:hypothetical protein